MQGLQHWLSTGGLLMYPLVLCSIISLTVVIERMVFWIWWRARIRPELLSRFKQADDAGRQSLLRHNSDPVLDFVATCCGNPSVVPGAARMELDRLRRRFGRLLPVLETVVSIAPLLGILGTVVGIIISFDLAGQSTRLEPAEAIGGIAQAFVTTAYGLLISIPSLVAFNYFANLEQRAIHQLRDAVWAIDGTMLEA